MNKADWLLFQQVEGTQRIEIITFSSKFQYELSRVKRSMRAVLLSVRRPFVIIIS